MDNPFMVSARYLMDFFEAKHLAWSTSHFEELRGKVNERHDRLRRQTPDDVAAEAPEVFFGVGVGGNSVNSSGDSDRGSFSWETTAASGVVGVEDVVRSGGAFPNPAAKTHEASGWFGHPTKVSVGPGGGGGGGVGRGGE
ncbi:unnamed protein product, partial [Hapterophycus canaliculatus]